MAPSGPQLPSSKLEQRKRKEFDEKDNDTKLVSPPIDGPDIPASKKQRIIGPSLPPNLADSTGPLSTSEKSDSDDDSDSSDDDDFGPRPPSNSKIDTASASVSFKTASEGTDVNPPSPVRSKRDDWMVVPPSGGDWTARVDPTKLKSRKFNTGKGARSTVATGNDANTWHETPAEKQARLQREMMGVKDQVSTLDSSDVRTATKQDEEISAHMKEYQKSRGPTLYEAHQKNKTVEKDDDPSARAFDREKDIRGGLQPNSTQRRDMMKKAGDFNSRFSSARYL